MPESPTLRFSTARAKLLLGVAVGWVATGAFLLLATPPWKGTAGKFTKQGKEFGVEEYTQVGLWKGAVILMILLSALLLTQRWWLRWSERSTATVIAPTKPQGRWQWIGLLAAIVLAGSLRIPMADQSLLRDEHDNLRRNFHGFTAMDAKPGTDAWHPAGYREALFENERANNPFFYSVLAHLSLDAWHALTGSPRDRFHVVPMRIPALVLGLLGIATVWGLGLRLGGPWLATTAALLCALHPLHIRYSVEARGYAVVLWLAPLFLSQCWDVIGTGRWRNAFGVSFAAAGLLYAFPGGVYFIGMGCAALTWVLLWQQRSPANRASFMRLGVAGSLALGIMLLLMMPGLKQALVNLDSQFAKNGLAPPWFAQTWHWMTVGIHNPLEQEYFTLRDGAQTWANFWWSYLNRAPVTFAVAVVVIPLLLWTGARALWRKGGAGPMIVLISVGAPLLCLLHHGLLTKYSIFQWYMIYALPPLVVIASLGLLQMLGPKATATAPSPGHCLAWAAMIGTYALATYPPVGSRVGVYSEWPEDRGLPTARWTLERGPNTWVTYQDGRVLRLGKTSVTKGRDFLLKLKLPELDLLPEFAGHNVIWLYHDNYLAAKVLAPSHPEEAAEIMAAIRRYGVTHSGKIEMLFGASSLPLRQYRLSEVAKTGKFTIKSEFSTDELNPDYAAYADLLFFAAIAEKDPAAAKAHFAKAMAMHDGTGFMDSATKQSGRYATYKLALALKAARVLSIKSPVLETIRSRLLSLQTETGGWVTDYLPDGTPVGFANVETTCLAILALE